MDEYLVAALVVLVPVISGALPRLMKRRNDRLLDETTLAAIERSSSRLAEMGVTQVGYAKGRRRRISYRRIALSSDLGGELSFYIQGREEAEIEQEILNGGFAFQVMMTARKAEKTESAWQRIPSRTTRAWWRVLGISQEASENEIRAAWRERARSAHPDAGGSDASMSEINVARDSGLVALRQRSRTEAPPAKH